jgi:hypothetical protein
VPANQPALNSSTSQAPRSTASPTQPAPQGVDYFDLGSDMYFPMDGALALDTDLNSFQDAQPTNCTTDNLAQFPPIMPGDTPVQDALVSPIQQKQQQPEDMIEQQDISPPQPFDEWANMDLGTGGDFSVFQDLAFMTNDMLSPEGTQTMHNRLPQQQFHPPHLGASGSKYSPAANQSANSRKPDEQQHPLRFANEHTSDQFANLPYILWDNAVHLPKPSVNDVAYQEMRRDMQSRLSASECSETPIPSAKDIQKFVLSYITCFHRHLPIIHFASFDIQTTPSPLTFAVCAIGALYRLDRKWSSSLFQLATQMLEVCSIPTMPGASLAPSPLWIAQTRILLSIFGMFGGKPAIARAGISRLGFFMMDYSVRRTALLADTRRNEDLTWEEWICKESSKRYSTVRPFV